MKQRIHYIDIAKGILILLIVRYHLCFSDFPGWMKVDTLVRYIHVPVFFVIAGFFLKESSFSNLKNFYKRKINNLYIKSLPYFVCGVVFHNAYAQGRISIAYSSFTDYCKAFAKVFTATAYEPSVGPLWFAEALLWAFVAIPLIYNISNKSSSPNRQTLFISFIIYIIVWYVTNKMEIDTLLRIQVGFSSIIFILCGKVYYQNIEEIKRFRNLWGALLSVFILFFYTHIIQYSASPIINIYPDPFAYLLTTLSAAYITLYVSRLIEKYKFTRIIELCGSYSFHIMAGHLLCIYAYVKILEQFGIYHSLKINQYVPNSWLDFFCMISVGATCPIILVKCLTRLKNRIKS